jgi:hypothetical protein
MECILQTTNGLTEDEFLKLMMGALEGCVLIVGVSKGFSATGTARDR